jgi:hypothetical protein
VRTASQTEAIRIYLKTRLHLADKLLILKEVRKVQKQEFTLKLLALKSLRMIFEIKEHVDASEL